MAHVEVGEAARLADDEAAKKLASEEAARITATDSNIDSCGSEVRSFVVWSWCQPGCALEVCFQEIAWRKASGRRANTLRHGETEYRYIDETLDLQQSISGECVQMNSLHSQAEHRLRGGSPTRFEN